MERDCEDCVYELVDPDENPCTGCIGTAEKCNWVRENGMWHTRATAINLVDAERDRQDKKWGIQNHTHQAWVGILGEEFGEYCQCVNETYLSNATKKHEGGYDLMLKELTHVAAVAVGAMESLMRNREEDK